MSDITTLFNRDPAEMADADIDSIIEYMRKKRHEFATLKTSGKEKAKPKLTEKQQQAVNQ